jgi:hypothetical protein
MKVDILFSASSRPEFTAASLAALRDNTDWTLVRELSFYLESPGDAVDQVVGDWIRDMALEPRVSFYLVSDHFGGPVGIMLEYLRRSPGEIVAKIDNDVIVPPGWLEAAAGVMDRHPELDLLGLEPPRSRTPAPWAKGKRPPTPELDGPAGLHNFHGYARCEAVGGVGLFRRRAFEGRPAMVPHSIYGGFTDWQLRHPDVTKGWIVPPISLFLLDRLPVEPWASLSREYIARGYQRPWTNYGPEASKLWEWWLERPAR